MAGDGVLEINQTCAKETGCFPGDDPGFPVTIDLPGSYRLTSNLSLGGPDTSAIIISTSYVTVNLGGFRIGCSVFDPGPPPTVAPCGSEGGSGVGVWVGINNPTTGVEVSNGSIVGMGFRAVSLAGEASVVRDLRIEQSAAHAIDIDEGIVSGNVITENGLSSSSSAVRAGRGLVERNVIRRNANDGLSLGVKTGYRGNVSSNNGGQAVLQGVNLGGNLCEDALCP
jgi:hypothetical protein